MKLDDFTGEHKLMGFDICDEGCKFVLDGVTVVAVEDEDDGYRSFLDEVRVESGGVSNLFPPCSVIGQMDEEILVFVDEDTKKTVLRVGTDNSDSYYPYFVSEFTPENMAINKNRV